MDENTDSMTPAEELKHMRELYGMKRSEFCEHFGILYARCNIGRLETASRLHF